MAEKEKTGLIKLQIAAGQANPAPPVGPALGQHCLLYTSPSPRDRYGSRMPSSA